MLFVLLLYFPIVIVIAALVLLPAVRDCTRSILQDTWARLRMRRRASCRHIAAVLHQARARPAAGLRKAIAHGTRHRRVLASTAVAILLPPAVAMAYRHAQTFDYTQSTQEPDAITTAVLTGERLSPPPPLPPEAFTTREVELVGPRLDLPHASREWAMLDDDFAQRLLRVYKIMRERYGYEMTLLEGYRSPARQARLAALGSAVTGAGPYESYHQYGLAADSAFVRDGRLVITERDPWAMRGYALYGETAQALGLTWGGQWTLKDYGHVELPTPSRRRRKDTERRLAMPSPDRP